MLKEQLPELLKQAMKDRDITKTKVLRAIKSEFTKAETAKNAKSLDEMAVLKMMKKQRLDSADQYSQAGRQELADMELYEIDILDTFIPKAPTYQEAAAGLIHLALIHEWVNEDRSPVIPKKEMGTAIKELKIMYPTADGKLLSDLVKEYIAK